MAYTLWVGLGVALAFVAARVAPVPSGVSAPRSVQRAALIGAVLGAHLFELPADLWGLTAEASTHGTPLLGRTVLGGLLGGWIAVELEKKRIGFAAPTGDTFALPLAIGLTFGRLGCVVTGCCPGRAIDATSALASVSLWLGHGPRFPATLVEAYFHATSALALIGLRWRGWLLGRHLAAYLAAYAVLRFVLELGRANPAVLGPLTYYQLLSIAVLALAAVTLWRRSVRGAGSPEAALVEQLGGEGAP